MARSWGARRRWAIAAAVVVILVSAIAVAWPYGQRYIGTAPPAQFYQPVQPEPALIQEYSRVLGVGHNAGNNPQTLMKALRHRADVIEIDVISARGRLVAGRDQPWPWLARQLFRGPTLADAWSRAVVTGQVKLDLKQGDRRFLDELVAFLTPRMTAVPVMISSGDEGALRYLRGRLPSVTLLFSIGRPDGVDKLESDAGLQGVVNGVSVFEGLVDPELMGWVRAHGLMILAWTVNDGHRLNELVRLGVDGITTDNLAILQMLG